MSHYIRKIFILLGFIFTLDLNANNIQFKHNDLNVIDIVHIDTLGKMSAPKIIVYLASPDQGESEGFYLELFDVKKDITIQNSKKNVTFSLSKGILKSFTASQDKTVAVFEKLNYHFTIDETKKDIFLPQEQIITIGSIKYNQCKIQSQQSSAQSNSCLTTIKNISYQMSLTQDILDKDKASIKFTGKMPHVESIKNDITQTEGPFNFNISLTGQKKGISSLFNKIWQVSGENFNELKKQSLSNSYIKTWLNLQCKNNSKRCGWTKFDVCNDANNVGDSQYPVMIASCQEIGLSTNCKGEEVYEQLECQSPLTNKRLQAESGLGQEFLELINQGATIHINTQNDYIQNKTNFDLSTVFPAGFMQSPIHFMPTVKLTGGDVLSDTLTRSLTTYLVNQYLPGLALKENQIIIPKSTQLYIGLTPDLNTVNAEIKINNQFTQGEFLNFDITAHVSKAALAQALSHNQFNTLQQFVTGHVHVAFSKKSIPLIVQLGLKQAKVPLKALIDSQLLLKENNQYTVDMDFHGNQITLNGKQYTPEDLLTTMMALYPSQPTQMGTITSLPRFDPKFDKNKKVLTHSNKDDHFFDNMYLLKPDAVPYQLGYIAAGGNIANYAAGTEQLGPQACATKCKLMLKCGGWTTNEQGYCWLKEIGYNAIGIAPGWKYNLIRRLPKLEVVDTPVNINYGYIVGEDLPRYNSGTQRLGVRGCAALCEQNPECSAWTVNEDNLCWLKAIGSVLTTYEIPGWKYNVIRGNELVSIQSHMFGTQSNNFWDSQDYEKTYGECRIDGNNYFRLYQLNFDKIKYVGNQVGVEACAALCTQNAQCAAFDIKQGDTLLGEFAPTLTGLYQCYLYNDLNWLGDNHDNSVMCYIKTNRIYTELTVDPYQSEPVIDAHSILPKPIVPVVKQVIIQPIHNASEIPSLHRSNTVISDSYACYWMNPQNNNQWEKDPIMSEAGCRQADSCSPGGGHGSGDGCYKWATSLDSPGKAW